MTGILYRVLGYSNLRCVLVSLQSVNRGLGVRYIGAKANDSVNTINQVLHVSCVVSNRLSLKKKPSKHCTVTKKALGARTLSVFTNGKEFLG